VPRILSKAGESLADVYDVEGSVIQVADLVTGELPIVHDMASTVMSERMHMTQLTATSGAVPQSANFGAQIANWVDVPTRIMSIAVIGDTASRLSHITITQRDDGGAEHPLLVWDSAQDVERICRIDLLGVGVSNNIIYAPSIPVSQVLMVRDGETSQMGTFIMNGTTTAFGAGSLEVLMCVLVARPTRDTPAAGDAKSWGLPLPSW